MKEFSEILKEKRKEKGITQEELGAIVHVSRSAIAKYENGLGLPSEEVIQLLLHYFEMTREELFPQKESTNQLVEKNKTIHRQKKMIIAVSVLLSVSILALAGIGISKIGKRAHSGGMIILKANHINTNYSTQTKKFKAYEKEFGYRNVKRNESNEFILAAGGQIWSYDGRLDHLMGYYHGEGTSLYVYETPQNATKIEYIQSGDKYCFNASMYPYSNYQFVITNETEKEINIGFIEFWC